MPYIIYPPESPLAVFSKSPHLSPQLVFLTGEQGSGKSTHCADLVNQARGKGIRIAGFLSKAVFSQGQKIAIELEDLASGERRRLAARRPVETLEGSSDYVTESWVLEADTVAWGEGFLGAAAFCELLVLDELGPLELSRGKGLQTALSLIERRDYRWACAVVRPALLSIAFERWPWGRVVDVSRTEQLTWWEEQG